MPAVDRAYLETLKRHQWPGNLRELRNVAELYAVGIVKLAGAEQVIPLASGKGRWTTWWRSSSGG